MRDMSWSLSRRKGDGKCEYHKLCKHLATATTAAAIKSDVENIPTLHTFGRNCHAFRMWENGSPSIFIMVPILSLNIALVYRVFVWPATATPMTKIDTDRKKSFLWFNSITNFRLHILTADAISQQRRIPTYTRCIHSYSCVVWQRVVS